MQCNNLFTYCLILQLISAYVSTNRVKREKLFHADDESSDEADTVVESNSGDKSTFGTSVVESYILARQEVEAELEHFYKTAHIDDIPDLESDALIRLRSYRDKLYNLGLPLNDLHNLLDGDPGFQLEMKMSNGSVRTKRTIEINEDRRWTSGIVPYLIADEVREKREISRAMHTLERYTCIRFYPWEEDDDGTNTNDKLNLDHQSYLKFVDDAGCWSFLGNLRKARGKGGQLISCCGGVTCIHEIGHAMGETHEQQSPNPDRKAFMRVNWDNIKPGYVSAYATDKSERVISSGYDMSSYMHYSTYTFRKAGSGMDTFIKFFPELPTSNSHHYMFKEISESHKCQDMCSDFPVTCENDGYLTLIDGKCACECIPGLDPATGCVTIYKNDPEGLSFPGGQYAMPATVFGCPSDTFLTGSRTQNNYGINSKSDQYDLGGDVTPTKVEQKFCISTESQNNVSWPNGNYCLYRKGGSCPERFVEGFVQYNDHPSDATPNAQSGELPDGIFGDNTRLEYCCSIGFSGDSLLLPSRQPFALIRRRGQACQAVKGMHSYTNVLRIDNSGDADGQSMTGGDHPVAYIDSLRDRYSTYFCYYKPAFRGCGDIIDLNSSNPEVTIMSPRKPELECYWLAKAPTGARLQLDFIEFDIKGAAGDCVDEVEVRYVRMGQPGITHCGRRWDKTVVSINNTIHLRLSTRGDSSSYFTARVKVVLDEDLCYSTADRGMTYAGNVNFTQDFEPCLPWNEMTHCEMHPFKTDAFSVTLTGNMCRNPDQSTGFMPWCYTKSDGCVRNYCDVCGIGKRFDTVDNCDDIKAAGQCSMKYCAKSCSEKCSVPPAPKKVNKVACTCPNDVEDATPVESLKQIYRPGESITYRCDYADTTQKRYCLTSGEWSPLKTACVECPDGFIAKREFRKCFYFLDESKHHLDARAYCSEKQEAYLAVPDSHEENAYFRSFTSSKIWIGLTDEEEEGTWVTFSGRPFNYTNWMSGQPSNYGKKEHCSEMYKSDGTWNDIDCRNLNYKRKVLCEKPMVRVQDCLDYSDNCKYLFKLYPRMCSEFPSFAEERCRLTCALCGSVGAAACKIQDPVSGQELEVDIGAYIHHTCPEDFVQIGGDSERGCTISGDITGKPINCAKTCPNGWSLNSDNLSCYLKFGGKETFSDAQAICQSYGGRLATAKDPDELAFLGDLAANEDIWLGFQDINIESKWVWIDGTISTWTTWNYNEPNGGSVENCAVMRYNLRWIDANCESKKFSYICQVSLHDFI